MASYENGMALLTLMGVSDQIVPLTSRSIAEQDIYVMFSKNTVTQAQVDQFSDALKKFKTTPAYGRIYRKYFGATVVK